MHMIPAGKRVVADRGYRGANKVVSFRNDLDTDRVKEFKRRCLSSHENFNCRLNSFRSLKELFRHNYTKHSVAFDAVLVVCQLELMNGNPLFDV